MIDMEHRRNALMDENNANDDNFVRIPNEDEAKTIQAISQLLDGLSFEDVEFILAKVQDDLPRGAVYHGIVFSPS